MPTAALISGGLGVAGSVGSGLLQYFGTKNATNQNLQFQEGALQQLQSILGPVLSAGQGVLSQGQGIVNTALGPLTKLLTPGANMTDTLSQIPGFQFAQDWGEKAVKNLGTTMGLGGNTLASGAQYATGLAQQGYGQIVQQLQNLLGTGAGLTGTGLSGLASTAGALGSGTAGILSGMGNTAAAGTIGQANAAAGALTGGANAAGNAALLYGLSNRLQPTQTPSGIYGAQPQFGSGTPASSWEGG